MYVILVYDVQVERVQKVLKTCRKYLYWVQNSVFEGEITQAKLEKLKHEINKIIEDDTDSVIIYTFLSERYSNREILGVAKGGMDILL
ncbi:MAG: CRISPR-associated endonuclease Cas2 [Candidatus Hydrothermia bacterium]|nr:CRISPR-associated endonuclease Cas2 [Candidatus Hydrothermae bacterium]MDD3649825.1 CRISPR-associated endonuclease Cas2 [Candidatus Hydrothermia bacterium]HOQ17347.1 CRISPR-associated endonuclease Cas2 [Defluviitaleaceae bacterium]MDD5573183.1 CRISPR-associated endonuclease Cas2 [Candidatus Hydrothermia bacterium]HOK23773.1 CRISPR-associated endonuclease Cas2 [Candidatus Hydrothermia bacterium]